MFATLGGSGGLLQNGTLLGLEHAYLVAQRDAAFLRSPAIHCLVAVVLPQLALLTAPACVCTHSLQDSVWILVFDPQSLHSAALCTSAMPVPAGLLTLVRHGSHPWAIDPGVRPGDLALCGGERLNVRATGHDMGPPRRVHGWQ